MYDDLYCQNIYNFFYSNTLLRMTCSEGSGAKSGLPVNFKGQMEALFGNFKNSKMWKSQLFAQMCDRTI